MSVVAITDTIYLSSLLMVRKGMENMRNKQILVDLHLGDYTD